MIKISLTSDISIGDTVRYKESTVDFHSIDEYTGEQSKFTLDVSSVTGTVIELLNSNYCKVEFKDTSFLPIGLKQDNIWYVNLDLLEAV